MLKRTLSNLACMLLLAACGTTPEERAVSGAGVGAGAGAVIGAITGLTVLEAAALGAVGGALTGALTKPDQVNLGNPAWKQGVSDQSVPAANATPAVVSSTVVDIQRGLTRLGYDCGQADGIYGPRTRNAIRQYQEKNGLVVDGHATPELARHIDAQGS